MVVDRFGTYRGVPRDVSMGISVKGADRFRTYPPPTSGRIEGYFRTYPDHLRTYPHHVPKPPPIRSGRGPDTLYSSPPFANLHSLTTPKVWSKADDTLVLKIVWDILPPHLYISSESGQFVVGAVEVVGALRSGTAV